MGVLASVSISAGLASPLSLCLSLPPCPPLLFPLPLSEIAEERESWQLAPCEKRACICGWAEPCEFPSIAVFLEGNAMLEPGLNWTGKVAGSSAGPGSCCSQRLESQECLSSENSQTPMDFRFSQPFLLHLCTFLLPPEMAPDLQGTFERSYLLTDGKKWILHLII